MRPYKLLGTRIDTSSNRSSHSFRVSPRGERLSRRTPLENSTIVHVSPIPDDRHYYSTNRSGLKLPFLRSNQSPTSILRDTSLQRDLSPLADQKEKIPEIIMSPFPLPRISIERLSPNNNVTLLSDIRRTNRTKVNPIKIPESRQDLETGLPKLRTPKIDVKIDVEAVLANMRDISIIAPPKLKAPENRTRSEDIPRNTLDEMLEIPLEYFETKKEKGNGKPKIVKRQNASIMTFMDKKLPLRFAYRRKSCYCHCCGGRSKLQRDVENNPWVSLFTGWQENTIANTFITKLYKAINKETKLAIPANKIRRQGLKTPLNNMKSHSSFRNRVQAVVTQTSSKKSGLSKKEIQEKRHEDLKARYGAPPVPATELRIYLSNNRIRSPSKDTKESQDPKKEVSNVSSVGQSIVIHSNASSAELEINPQDIKWPDRQRGYDTPEPEQDVQSDHNMLRTWLLPDQKPASKQDLASLSHLDMSHLKDSESTVSKRKVSHHIEELQMAYKPLSVKKPTENQPKTPIAAEVRRISTMKKKLVVEISEERTIPKIADNSHTEDQTSKIRRDGQNLLRKIIGNSTKNFTKRPAQVNENKSKEEGASKDDSKPEEEKRRPRTKRDKEKRDGSKKRNEEILKVYRSTSVRNLAASLRASPLNCEISCRMKDMRDLSSQRNNSKGKKREGGNIKIKLRKIVEKKVIESVLLSKKFKEKYNGGIN